MPGASRLKIDGFMSGPGINPALVTGVGLLGGSRPGPGPSGQSQSGPKPGYPEPLLPLSQIQCAFPNLHNSSLPVRTITASMHISILSQ